MVEKYNCSTCACCENHPIFDYKLCKLNPPQYVNYGNHLNGWEYPNIGSVGGGCVSGWRPREGRIPHPDQVSLEYWK